MTQRLILIAMAIWLVYFVYKQRLGKTGKPQDHDKDQVKPPSKEPSAEGHHDVPFEDMVMCATCAVHIPRSEAFLVRGDFYCSKAHIKQK